MIPLRIVETDRPEFDEPVVELWRDDDFIGMVFWDGDEAVVQIYPDSDGDVYDIEINDLLRVLDTSARIVMPEGLLEEEGEGEYLQAFNEALPEGEWDDEHPATAALVDEFDDRVIFRTEDGEGFYDRQTALDMVGRCDELGLAIVELDGFEMKRTALMPRPELTVKIAAPADLDWGVQKAAANAQIRSALEGWPEGSTLVAALLIQQPDGESFIA